MTTTFPQALTVTPPGLPESETVGTVWRQAWSIDQQQRRVLRLHPTARRQALPGRINRWIAGGRIVAEMRPTGRWRTELEGWIEEASSAACGGVPAGAGLSPAPAGSSTER